MANIKITDLTAYAAPRTTDVIPIVDVTTDTTKKVAVGEVIGKITGDVDVATDGTSSITAGAIVNADVNASAAIAGTKIAPNFGSQTIQTTGVINAGSGTEAAPSVSVGTTNNGLYSPGTNQVALSTNGTGRLFISSDGKIGICTATPSSYAIQADDLVIAPSTSTAGISLVASTANFLYFSDLDAEGRGVIAYYHGDDSLRFATAASYHLLITSNGDVNIVGAGTAGVNQAVSFNGSAPVDSLVIDSSGRLLVGTSSSSAITSIVAQGNSTNTTGAGVLSLARGTSSISSGNQLGIIDFTDSSDNKFARIEAVADAATGTGDYPGRLVFSTTADGASSPTERMRISSDGTVDIAGNLVVGPNSAPAMKSDTTGVTGADQITNMISLTQAEYDAIGTPDANTFYVITA